MISEIAIRIRKESGIKVCDHDLYNMLCELWLHSKLKAVERPRVKDFECVFGEFEESFFSSVPAWYETEMAKTKNKRMLMAFLGYTIRPMVNTTKNSNIPSAANWMIVVRALNEKALNDSPRGPPPVIANQIDKYLTEEMELVD